MRKEIKGSRYNVKGYIVEEVTIAISHIGETIHLHIDGEKVPKHYTMKHEDWKRLIAD